MRMETFLHRNGQQLGPYSLAVLRAMHEQGELESTDLAWDADAQLWCSVSDLFRPATPPLPMAAPPRLPPQVHSGGDTVFFSSGRLTVTKTRFVVGAQTFALSGITSVRAVTFPPDTTGQTLLIVFGVISALISLGVFSSMSTSNGAAMLVVGLILALLAALLFWLAVRESRAQKPTYCVILRTSGGEVTAYQSHDLVFITLLLTALNEAIIARG